MSLLALDFPSGQTGLYGTTKSFMLDGIYAENTGITIMEDPDPNVTGNVIAFTNTDSPASHDGARWRRVLPASLTTVGFASRFYLPGLPTTTSALPILFEARNVSNSVLFSLRVETDGYITAYRGDSYAGGVSLGSSSSPAIVANAWQHVELKLVLSDTVGSIEVRVEGVVKLNITGVDTLNGTGPCTQIVTRTRNYGGGNVFFYQYYQKDIAVWDTAGSLNNNFLGSIAVYEIIPNGDVANTWGLSTGSTGYTLVDEAPPNDDTDYIYATNPPPAADKMSLTDLPADVTSVRGLIAVVRSKKTDGGDGNLQVGMISGASTGLGSDRPITTAYTYWQDVFEVDPATGVAWTRVGVNAANIQFNRTL